MAFSSDEVNYLVYRYMKESGFQHSAFVFAHESQVNNADVNPSDVQVGGLIDIIQKGLLYSELQAQIRKDAEPETPVLVKSIHKSLKQSGKKKQTHEDVQSSLGGSSSQGLSSSGLNLFGSTIGSSGATPSSPSASALSTSASALLPPGTIIDERNIDVKKDNVLILEGHQSEVFICAWNPKMPLLASGSSDSTARIWKVAAGPVGSKAALELSKNPVTLKHTNATKEKSKDVTTLDWSPSGKFLATGSYDGIARVWDLKGTMRAKLAKHNGPIFSLKWSKLGDYLLSGSVDKMAIIWEAVTGNVKQIFDFHVAPTLDVDWRNNTSFASCSSDKIIYVCELGKTRPINTFEGHTDEVNAVKWDPSGTLLASCSDDKTAKIWKTDQTSAVFNFADHEKEIYTLKWSPTGSGSRNPNKPLCLATASFDSTVKLWDPNVGKCIHTLSKHSDPVYSVAWSPDGDYVASGSFDRCLHVWSVRDGSLVKTYNGSGGIFEISWNAEGTKIAASFSDNTVAVVDIRA